MVDDGQRKTEFPYLGTEGVVTAQTFADACLTTLKRAMDNPRVIRDIQKQLQHMPQAILPLLSLGSEWNLSALWGVVCALDCGRTGVPFSADDPADVRRLEAALDSISAEIIDLLLPLVQQLIPDLSLSRGLIDSEWTIYAVIPREATLPTPDQLALW